MKNLLYGGVVALIAAQTLYADELTQRKAELERQIRELEAQQKQQEEIEALEQKLNTLKANTPATESRQAAPQRIYPTQTHQTPQYSPYSQEKITQKMRDDEVQKTFGKNRNGVLLGIGWAFTDLNYQYASRVEGNLDMLSLRIGYQRFPNNDIFGWRFYIDGFAGIYEGDSAKPTTSTLTQTFGAWNFDILMDINIPDSYNYLGLFVGLGYGIAQFGYNSIFSTNHSAEYAELQINSLFYNFGIAFTANAKHRLELYCKLPATREYNDKFYWKTSAIGSLTYQYTF